MAYVKVRPPVKIYHLTGKDNLNSILDDGVIRRFNDTECWFCESLDKMRAYMEQTSSYTRRQNLSEATAHRWEV